MIKVKTVKFHVQTMGPDLQRKLDQVDTFLLSGETVKLEVVITAHVNQVGNVAHLLKLVSLLRHVGWKSNPYKKGVSVGILLKG